MNKYLFVFFSLLILGSCYHVPENLEPKINYTVQDKYLKDLPSPFPPLSEDEKSQSWGREYQIGIAFANKLDLYQAITAFKRAEILIPEHLKERKLEIYYEILLCYYLGKKFSDVAEIFETTDLRLIDNTFPACHDLLIILYDTYTQLGDTEKRDQILSLIKHYYPAEADKLALSDALSKADFPALETYSKDHPGVKDLLTTYEQEKKSVTKAKTLNAVLPGAGYFYLGQPQMGMTALLLNGLFIGAAYHFFHRGNVPAGVIFTSFEMGWYFGGIHGAGEEAKFYNEHIYEKHATPMMNQQGLFPVFMLNHAF
jgi:tetratricopeptide (TPR) repeat protein